MIERDDYISIVIPSFNRYHYLETVVNSIHEFADFPFEIIIHDDASLDGTFERLITDLSDKVSTIIANKNKTWNMGLGESTDRAVALATSKYIIMLNSDCKITRGFFKDVVNVLNKSYVGFIPLHEDNILTTFYKANETKFCLRAGLGSGCALAFRKDVWQKVDGFSGRDGMWTGGADTHFINAVWKVGYFRGVLDGITPVYNMSLLDSSNLDTTINGRVSDCSLPKIFSTTTTPYDYKTISRSRYAYIDHYKHNLETLPYERNNSQFWHIYTSNFVEFPIIEWDKLEAGSPHLTWKNEILLEQLYTL